MSDFPSYVIARPDQAISGEIEDGPHAPVTVSLCDQSVP